MVCPVDEHVAKLKIDSFPCRLGRHQNLGFLPEVPLGVDACARSVAVADFHPAVNLCDLQTPFAEFAERPAVLPIARKVIQRVLVFGKYKQFGLGIGEDGSHSERASAPPTWARLPLLKAARLGNRTAGLRCLRSCGWVDSDGRILDLVIYSSCSSSESSSKSSGMLDPVCEGFSGLPEYSRASLIRSRPGERHRCSTQSALEHRHSEADGPPRSRIVWPRRIDWSST